MSTVADLKTDVTNAMAVAGWLAQDARRDELRIARSGQASRIMIASSEMIVNGSNQSLEFVTCDLQLMIRAASGTIAAAFTAQATLDLALSQFADPTWWTALDSVRESPQPDMSFSAEIQRIGELYTFTVRAELALEV